LSQTEGGVHAQSALQLSQSSGGPDAPAASQIPSPQAAVHTAGTTPASQTSPNGHAHSSPGPPHVLQSSPASQTPSPQTAQTPPQSAGQLDAAQVSVPEQQSSPQTSGQLSCGQVHGSSPASQMPSLLQLGHTPPAHPTQPQS